MSLSSSRFYTLSCSTAVALFLGAPAAFADLTGANVWADWRGYMEGFGYGLTADEAVSGNTLTVSNVVMSLPLEGQAGTVGYTIPTLDFVTNADGTVNVVMAPHSDLTMQTKTETGEVVDIAASYDTANFQMVASGDPSALTYTYSADTMDITLDSVAMNGTTLPADAARFVMSVANIKGTTDITVADKRTYDQTMTSGAVTYDAAFVDPEGQGRFALKGGTQGMTFGGVGDLPADGQTTDIGALLAAGFDFSGTFGFLAGNMNLNFDGPDGAGTASTSSQGGNIGVAMGQEGLRYDVTQNGLDVNMLMPDVPLPISFKMQQSKFNLTMPMQKSDEEQDFAFGFKMGDFTMSDMIWGIFDPTGQLPRDPATIAIDLTGKAKVLFDFFDPAQAAALESSGAVPGELNALTLQNLVVDAVGARLSGKGDFVFDNTDLVSFGGIPKPEGAVDLELVGGNGLIDKLVAMGLLPEQQAMGARMMMGLFAVPGEGDDTLNSKIEFNDQGHILANGQRIQ
ncbi:DUF2125 domain-containing protein [Ascidiaceihabitans sp.]|uniref:DUF2125 domain-containing protein n=1 Tax=Ascidiaceihabitans sp. TaxID=1872644 RepID=UPI0032977160